MLNPEKTVHKIGNGELQVEHGLAGVMEHTSITQKNVRD